MKTSCAVNIPATVLLLVLGSAPIWSMTKIDQATHDLLKEAQRSWQRWADTVPLLQGEFTIAVYTSFENRSIQSRGQCKSNGSCRLLHLASTYYTANKVDTTEETVVGINSRYGFMLRKNGSDFVCEHLELKRHALFSNYLLRKFQTHDEFLLKLCSVDHQPLADLVKESYFTVVKVESVEQQGRTLVKIEFTCPHQPDNKQRNRAQRGTLLLDPNRNWLICDSTAVGETENAVGQMWRRFTSSAGGTAENLIGTLEEDHTWEFREEGKTIVRIRADFNLRLPEPPPPERDFTLSAFGLPEPPGVTWERSTPGWLYGILVGFALILVSGILYKVIRRLRTQAT